MAASAGLKSPLTDFPTLKAFHARVRELPQLEGYFTSAACRMPCNNKMANFK